MFHKLIEQGFICHNRGQKNDFPKKIGTIINKKKYYILIKKI